MDVEKLKAQSKDAIERVWKFTGERNEKRDLYPGASLNVINYGDDVRVFVKNSGRELSNVKVDKTIPFGNYNEFRILEVRENGNLVDSIKVLACELSEEKTPFSTSISDNNNAYYLIGGVAFLIGLSGWLLYRKTKR